MSTIDFLPTLPRPKTPAPAILRRLPALTLTMVAVGLLAAFVVTQAAHGFTDPDYWWHVKTGEYIVLHRSIPRVDIFSATAAGRPWVAHEWLSEVIIYLLVRAGGYGLALAFFTLSPLLSVLLLARLLHREGVAAVAALPVLALSTVMIALYTTVRPQVLSWLFLTVLVSVLYEFRAGRIRHLWGLPVLFALWANLHLSFLIGLGILGLFVAAQAGEEWLQHRRIRVGHAPAVLGLCLAASCINPQGPRLLVYPLAYLPLEKTVLPAIAEWQTPDFHSYVFVPLLAALLLLLVTGLTPRRLNLWPAGLGLLAAGLALQSVRYVPVFAIAFAPLAGVALAERWPRARLGCRNDVAPARSAIHWTILAASLVGLAALIHGASWSEFQASPRTAGQLVPVHAVDVIQQQFPDARIFNQYEWGGYLIYRLWPRQRPFVDGRNDMFDPKFLGEYFRTWSAQPGWEDTLDRYGVTLVLVRSDSSLAGALQTNSRWRLVSRDTVATVYVRR